MPLFFFHVYDGYSTTDTEGTDLPDWLTARREAIRLAGQILDNEAERLLLGEEWRMEVTDAAGLVLFRLEFRFAEAAAAPTPALGTA